MNVAALRPFANLLGVVLTAIFFLATGMAGSVAVAMTFVYYHEPRLSPLDLSMWRWCAAAVPVGGLLSWASFRLANYKRPARRRARRVTMDPAKRARQERWSFTCSTAVAVAIVGIVVWRQTDAALSARTGRAVSWALGFYLLLHARILWHELGHLVAGTLVGVQPMSICVGTGPVVWQRVTASGFWWEWRWLPWRGRVHAAEHRVRPAAWRFFIMVAGGPTADVLCLGLLIYALQRSGALRVLLPGESLAGSPGAMLGLMPLYLLIGSALADLVPARVTHEGQILSTDGWWLCRTLFLPAAFHRERACATTYAHLQRLREAGYEAQASAEAASLLAQFPERRAALSLSESQRHLRRDEPLPANACFQRALDESGDLEPLARALAFAEHAAVLARLGQPDAARACCQAVLARTPATKRVVQLDAFACVPFYHQGARALLPDAESWCREALELAPGMITLCGTHGALLFEQGRIEEAEPLLRQVLADTRSDLDRGIASFYLALIAAGLGQRREMLARRTDALRWCQVSTLLQRIDAELQPTPP